MKIRVRCSKCGYEIETEVIPKPLGSLKPDAESKAKGMKIKGNPDVLDKILEASQGASLEELHQLGIEVDKAEWESAMERRIVRKFIKENLRVSRELKRVAGEKYQVSTEPWRMGDSFKDIDLPSSEVKSMGLEDLRLIPGVTLQKRVYGYTKGRSVERLKGIKIICILDTSGSMFYGSGQNTSKGKIGKALLLAEETWKICKANNFDFYLALFTDTAVRIPQKRIKDFFTTAEAKRELGVWNGGTVLSKALDLFTDKEYKDANVIIISDMDIADFEKTRDKIKEIALLTNSFKIILIEKPSELTPKRIEETQSLFPEGNVKILAIEVKDIGI